MLDVKLKLAPGHTSERSWMEPAPLRQLVWNITYACNFHCDICFTDAGRAAPDELTTDEARALVRAAGAAGVRDAIISGGEPFARPDMIEILACMAEVGMTARVASNGSLLSDQLLERLGRETLVKSFQISLDTLEADLYCCLHRVPPGTLERVLGTLRAIREHGFHTTVSARLTPETLPRIPDVLDRACVEGWSTVTVHCPVHTRRVEGAFPPEADMLSILEPVFDHFCSLPQRWLAETYIPWAPYHPAMKRLERCVRVVHRGCSAARDRLTVSPAGFISPCVCMDMPEAYVGNVRDDDLSEVFRTATLCRMMRRPQEHGLCTDCPEVAVCGAGCRASALALTGRVDGPDDSCPLRQRRTADVRARSHAQR